MTTSRPRSRPRVLVAGAWLLCRPTSAAPILIRAADRIVEQQEELARLLARENGKPIRQTREEVAAAARIFRGFGQEATRLFGRQVPMDAVPGMERHVAFTIRQPIGVVAAIVPFNYPVELYAHKAAAALAAGNAVIGKPPSDCPLAVLRIAAILEEAGLPRATHQVLTGPGSRIGPALAADPGVDLVTVTGSVATGVELGRIAAEHHKPFLAELGGNDAVIVCADADLEKAATAIVLGRLARGNGQICCAVKRVLVDATVVDAFVTILVRMTRELRVGDALDEQSDVGPLITEAAAAEVQGVVDAAVAGGASLLAGGPRRGAFIQPTVLGDVPANATVVREETFGPVVPVLPFRTDRRCRRHGQRFAVRPPGGSVHPRYRGCHGHQLPVGGGWRDGQLVIRAACREPSLRRREGERPWTRRHPRHAPRHDPPEGDPAARGAARLGCPGCRSKMTEPDRVEMLGIDKRYDAAQVLHGVDFSAQRGEIHALVGENGAGKSTLMRILAGVVSRDAGTISLDGERVDPRTPLDARRQGIRAVHQELSLVPHLGVTENLLLGEMPTSLPGDHRLARGAPGSAADAGGSGLRRHRRTDPGRPAGRSRSARW